MNDNHIDGWDTLHRREVEAAYSARREDAEVHAALVTLAAARGYRPATVAEILEGDVAALHTWRGEVWVRSEPPRQMHCHPKG